MRTCATTLEAEMTPQEQQFLTDLLRRHGLPGKHLEIGTAAGGTLWRMMRCFEDARPPFVVVDTMAYFPHQLAVVKQNLRDHGVDPAGVDFRVMSSALALEHAVAQDERFDFMLIDGSHKVTGVMADLRWTRLLNVGGIVCVHDYTVRHKGVKYAADRFLARYPNYERVGCGGSLLALRKTRTNDHAEVSATDRLFAMAWYVPLQIERKVTRRGKRTLFGRRKHSA